VEKDQWETSVRVYPGRGGFSDGPVDDGSPLDRLPDDPLDGARDRAHDFF
jgi:hypothetical protein